MSSSRPCPSRRTGCAGRTPPPAARRARRPAAAATRCHRCDHLAEQRLAQHAGLHRGHRLRRPATPPVSPPAAVPAPLSPGRRRGPRGCRAAGRRRAGRRGAPPARTRRRPRRWCGRRSAGRRPSGTSPSAASTSRCSRTTPRRASNRALVSRAVRVSSRSCGAAAVTRPECRASLPTIWRRGRRPDADRLRSRRRRYNPVSTPPPPCRTTLDAARTRRWPRGTPPEAKVTARQPYGNG